MTFSALLLALSTYMSTYFGTIRGLLSTLITRFNAHAFNRDNPHGVTQAQVGLSEVKNYPPATQVQAEEGLNNQSVMTPKRTVQLLDAGMVKQMTDTLDKAIADLS